MAATLPRDWSQYTPEEVVRIVLECADPTVFGGSQGDLSHHGRGYGSLSVACLFQPSGTLYGSPADILDPRMGLET